MKAAHINACLQHDKLETNHSLKLICSSICLPANSRQLRDGPTCNPWTLATASLSLCGEYKPSDGSWARMYMGQTDTFKLDHPFQPRQGVSCVVKEKHDFKGVWLAFIDF